jgi:hypothetical protein
MKVRTGFVSNSSSSSFVVVGKQEPTNLRLPSNYIIGQYGECEFGWQEERYEDINDLINFAFLQAIDNPIWMNMLEAVLRKHGVEKIESILDTSYTPNGKRWAYIDHQSSASEGQNTEMFKSEYALECFIFSNDSFIQCDNDNH